MLDFPSGAASYDSIVLEGKLDVANVAVTIGAVVDCLSLVSVEGHGIVWAKKAMAATRHG